MRGGWNEGEAVVILVACLHVATVELRDERYSSDYSCTCRIQIIACALARRREGSQCVILFSDFL
jgi:hypothetical protein